MLSPAPLAFKANLPDRPLPRLGSLSVLEIRGPDAAAFLQAQLMNDVAALATGRWQWNGWLNPKGRVIALLALLRLADQDFLALLPDFPAADLQPMLQRYVFRSKVVLRTRPELVGAMQMPSATDPSQPRDAVAVDDAGGLRLEMGAGRDARALWILPVGHPALSALHPATASRWRALDLACGLARLGADQVEAWTPHMLSLERLNAFSLSKGCYPGQEIVARTHYLGKVKRGLVRLQGQALEAGAPVLDDQGRELGRLLCAEGGTGLAVLPLDELPERLQSQGRELQILPLQEGLQRPL